MSLPSEESLSPPMQDKPRIAEAKSRANDDTQSQASSAATTQVEPRIADIIRVLANEKKEAGIVQMPESTSSTTQLEPRVVEFIRARANEEDTAVQTWVTARSHLSTTQVEPRVAELIRTRENEENMATHVPIEEITTLLINSALTEENARILIHSDHGSRHGMKSRPVITLLPEVVHGREIFAVSQTIHDVDLIINFSAPIELQFQIVYDPGSDDCLFVNYSSTGIRLSRSAPPYTSYVLKKGKGGPVQPGIWMVAADRESDSFNVFEFLLNERLFNVSIYEANISQAKRTADADADADADTKKSTKRQRLENNTAAEVIDTQSTSSLIIESGSIDVDTTSSRGIVNKAAVPILDLKDRETAVIRSQHTTGSESYRLQRIRQLGSTRNTSVFSCRHSGIPKRRSVVKVLRYNGSSALALPNFATLWKTEKVLLEKVKHENIVALEAFDGRMFAIYMELLPLSLNRGIQSPFKQSDAHTILLNMSSALSYLASHGIVHNDIKPDNIAYNPQRGAVLFDFGMACYVNRRPGGGSPWYLPPELMHNNTRGLPGDIWAMGVTMLYVLRKIKIPEKMARGWDIRELPPSAGEGSSAKAQMRSWINFITKERAQLDRNDNGVENAVFQMLEVERELRAVAEDIEEALGAY
ncbi:putative serine/threonine protein kinase [Trichoderma compactum]